MLQFKLCRSLRAVSASASSALLLFLFAHYEPLGPRPTAAAVKTPDEAAVRALAGEFYTHYAKEDLNAWMALWSAASPDAPARKHAASAFFAAHDRIEAANVTVRHVTVNGERAKARVDFELHALEVRTGKPAATAGAMRRTLEFVREGGAWRIWREQGAEESLAALLLATATEEERGRVLSSEKELVSAALVAALNKRGSELRTGSKLAEALNAHQLAQAIAEQINDRAGTALALDGSAVVLRRQGDYARAAETHKKSLTIFESLNDKRGMARGLNGLGNILHAQGDYGAALEAHGRSLRLAEEVENKFGVGISLNNIGFAHNELGNYALALDFYTRSLKLTEELKDKDGVKAALNNIGNIYRRQGEYEQALDYYGRSLKLSEELGDRTGIANSFNNIGLTYRLRGEPGRALEFLSKSWTLRESLGDVGVSGERILNGIGHIHFEQGDHAKAAEFYGRALALSEKMGNKQGIAASLNYLGDVSQSQGDLRKALDFAERAALLAEETNSRSQLVEIYTLTGEVRRSLRQFTEARRAFEKAVSLSEQLRANVSGAEMRASYFAKVDRPFKQFIALLMQMHGESPSAGHDALALHINERARARSLLESLNEARVDFRAGVDPVLLRREREIQQQLNARAERQTRLLSDKQTAEQGAALKAEIDTLSARYGEVQAQIRFGSPRYAALTQPVPLNLREIQQTLDPHTALLEYALGEERSYLWVVTPNSLATFELPKRAQIEEAVRRTRELLIDGDGWATSETIEASYEKAAGDLSRMLFPRALSGQLDGKLIIIVADGALQYIPFGALPVPKGDGSDKTVNAARTVSSPSTQPLIAGHEIVSLPSASVITSLRRDAEKTPRGPKNVAVLADPVFDVADERVAIASKIRERRDEKASGQVIHAASGGGKNTDADKAKLAGASGRSDSTPPRQAAVPDGLARAARASGVMRDGQQGIARLPFSRHEAEMILAAAPAGGKRKKALDFEASRATATSAELADYRIVHFATHGILNSEHPELSGIILSLVDEQGQPVDGFLRLNEIYNLRLPAELVVLSACQTGLGREIRGEGIVGLVRGFMYAGAPRVVASQWKVDDRATAELMKRFYEGVLRRGLRPAEALREAKIRMWQQKRWRAPFYWAAFELQGEWR